MNLQQTDPEIFNLIKSEEARQKSDLEMIPSENFVSDAVREAVGSVLMNKYSEGQPFKRYYQGNKYIDEIEALVEKRALQAFGLTEADWHVNVQPVTGSIANFAVYAALLNLGDKMLGMSLYDGGHLSHGWKLPDSGLPAQAGKPISFTSRIYDTYFYSVDPVTKVFDYDTIQKIAGEVKPKILISGGTAYPREINHKRMREIADSVGALYMADVAHEAGLIVGGANSSPFPHAHVVTMTTRKTLRGPIGAMIFASKKIKLEKSTAFTPSSIEDAIDGAVFPSLQGGPQNHSIAGIGVALHEAMQPAFRNYASQVVKNAQVLANELIKAGFDVVSGGTDKHLVLVDLRSRGWTGKDAALALEKVGIIANKNTVPGETGKPWNPSGLRLGTPALTTHGMNELDMVKIAQQISTVLHL